MTEKRNWPNLNKIDLTESQQELVVSLVDAGYELSCDLISNHWDKRWYKCPLCGAEIDSEGFIVHADIQ
jgi:hypothetical protein